MNKDKESQSNEAKESIDKEANAVSNETSNIKEYLQNELLYHAKRGFLITFFNATSVFEHFCKIDRSKAKMLGQKIVFQHIKSFCIEHNIKYKESYPEVLLDIPITFQ